MAHSQMHADWQKFMQQQATGLDSQPLSAAKTNLGVVLVNLSADEGLIEVTGPDRREFLQGQLSTDIRQLTANSSQLSSWNSAKGRVVTLLHVFERDDAILMALPSTLLASVSTRLRMYVLRTRVQIADASDRLMRFGIAGETAPTLLEQCGYTPPQRVGEVRRLGEIQVIRLHGVTPRFAIYGEAAVLQTLWMQFRQCGARPVESSTWTLLRILAGVPCVYPATSGHFVAQMLGLEELGAVHFNKGCYLGQEVIARAHYRGTVKRHLHRGSCISSEPIGPAMEIKDAATQQVVGEVVDAARDAQGTWQILAVLQQDARRSACTVQGATLAWQP